MLYSNNIVNEYLYRIRGVEVLTFELLKKSLVFTFDNLGSINM